MSEAKGAAGTGRGCHSRHQWRWQPPPDRFGGQTMLGIICDLLLATPCCNPTHSGLRQADGSPQNCLDQSFGQRSTTTFVCVKNSKACRAWPCSVPKHDSFQPLKGNSAIGAATPMLIPMLAASAS